MGPEERNHGLPRHFPLDLWQTLCGKLWHATGIKQIEQIIADGFIRPNAPAKYEWAFCRQIGAVSLFDFAVDPSIIFQEPVNWYDRLGHGMEGPIAVWLEINPMGCPNRIPTPAETITWHRDDRVANPLHPGKKIIAHLEVCHQGAIPVSALQGAVAIDKRPRHRAFQRMPVGDGLLCRLRAFAASLPPDRSPPSVADQMRRAQEALLPKT